MLTGARAEPATPTRTAPACAHGRAGGLFIGNASGRETVTPATGAVLPNGARTPIYGEHYLLSLAMLTFSPVASAAHAAAVAGADVVPFAWVADVVRDETRYRVALQSAERAGYVDAADAAERRDASAARVRDAVADAGDGWAADVVAVVVLESGNHTDAGTLNASGVPYVRPLGTVDGGYVARGRDGAAVAFDCIADAVAHAAGAACRRPILPGETMPPIAPSHGGDAPELPSIADAFRAANDQLRAIGDRAHADVMARLASMRATIDAELARGY